MSETTIEFKLEKVSIDNQWKFKDIDFNLELMKYITGSPLNADQAIRRYSFNLDDLHFGAYFVVSPGNEMLGLAVIKDTDGEAEIGYMVYPDYTGKGLATEINRYLINYCRQHIPARKVVGFVDSRNAASIRVLQKCGMVLEDRIAEDGNELLKYVTR